MKTILIVDGICPRGLAIIQQLSASGEYHILVFTKSTTCPGAMAVNSLPGVTLLLNRASAGYDLCTFVAAAQRCPSILICSSAANSEGKEGVQWGARLVQSAAQVGAKHIVFLSMEPERKQCSTDNFIHTQPRAPMSWTIIRSTVDTSCPQQPRSASERHLSPSHLRNLVHYVAWVFAHPERSTGLDFALPTATADPCGVASSSGQETKRRDSRATTSSYRVEGIHPHPASQGPKGNTRPRVSRTAPSGEEAVYMDAGRAKAIQQWVAKTTPEAEREGGDEEEEEEEDEEDDDDEDSGQERG